VAVFPRNDITGACKLAAQTAIATVLQPRRNENPLTVTGHLCYHERKQREVRKMKKNRRQYQRGFTLIELLVVIAILAVLFGVTALALNGVGSNAEQVTACAEKDVVQTSLDVYMAQNSLSTVTAQGTAGPVTAGTAPAGTYLRRDTKFQYTWNTSGTVLTVGNGTTTFTCP
jgi:prepilin-type N-terminal cleavage/methylation domain-containing protein